MILGPKLLMKLLVTITTACADGVSSYADIYLIIQHSQMVIVNSIKNFFSWSAKTSSLFTARPAGKRLSNVESGLSKQIGYIVTITEHFSRHIYNWLRTQLNDLRRWIRAVDRSGQTLFDTRSISI